MANQLSPLSSLLNPYGIQNTLFFIEKTAVTTVSNAQTIMKFRTQFFSLANPLSPLSSLLNPYEIQNTIFLLAKPLSPLSSVLNPNGIKSPFFHREDRWHHCQQYSDHYEIQNSIFFISKTAVTTVIIVESICGIQNPIFFIEKTAVTTVSNAQTNMKFKTPYFSLAKPLSLLSSLLNPYGIQNTIFFI